MSSCAILTNTALFGTVCDAQLTRYQYLADISNVVMYAIEKNGFFFKPVFFLTIEIEFARLTPWALMKSSGFFRAVHVVVFVMFAEAYDHITVTEAYDAFLDAGERSVVLASSLAKGCVTDTNPLTVHLSFNDGVSINMIKPWRISSWLLRDEVLDRKCHCPAGTPVYNETRHRTEHVTRAIQHAWNGYFAFAKNHDTLRPESRDGVDDFGSIRITAFDALDTLWMADLHAEYEQCASLVRQTVFSKDVSVNMFETTIRALGGLLGAHSLTGDGMYRSMAEDLGERLMSAFHNTERFAATDVNLRTLRTSDAPWGYKSLSEMSCTLEFYALADLRNDTRMRRSIDDHQHYLMQLSGGGLLPFYLRDDGMLAGNYRLGARADSFYEYLFKEYERSQQRPYLDSFLGSARSAREHLYLALDEQHLLVGERSLNAQFEAQMDHLVCFWPGVLALASAHDDMFLDEAQKIMNVCIRMHDTPHGIAPEITKYSSTDGLHIAPTDRHNLLRPEVLESLYVLWTQTKNETFCDWSWVVYRNLERAARRPYGYASIQDVQARVLRHMDEMPSYFLAETLKYALLCATRTDVTTTHVVNTEGHLLNKRASIRNSE